MATSTIAPSVASARSANNAVRKSIVTRAKMAVTAPASWLRAPLASLTAVCERPPPEGRA